MLVTTVATTYGALLLGGLGAISLSGVLGAQTFIYFKMYPKDPPRIKSVVWVIWIVDTFHSFFLCAGLWHDLIVEYGEPNAVDHIPWPLASTVACTAITTFIVQCFFAFRIYKFSNHNWYILAPILLLNVLRFAAATASATEMIHLGSFTSFRAHARWLATLGLSLSSGVDIVVTSTLCYYLRMSRSQALTLKPIIDLLFYYTFEAGALTCLSTFITMIFWVTMPHNIVFMGFHFLIEKLFANTLLITLNTRQYLRRERRSVAPSNLPMTSIEFQFQGSGTDGKRLTGNDMQSMSCDPKVPPPNPPTLSMNEGSTEGVLASPTAVHHSV